MPPVEKVSRGVAAESKYFRIYFIESNGIHGSPLEQHIHIEALVLCTECETEVDLWCFSRRVLVIVVSIGADELWQHIQVIHYSILVVVCIHEIAGQLADIRLVTILDGIIGDLFFVLELSYISVAPDDIVVTVCLSIPPTVIAIRKGSPFHIEVLCPGIVEISADVIGQFSNAVVVPDGEFESCLLYTSPSPRDISGSRMPSSA